MPAIYGRTAAEVVDPAGEVTLYLTTPAPARPHEWRAWYCVPPRPPGDAPPGWPGYRVSEYPTGRFGCDCPANTLGKNRGGRHAAVGKQPCCKHIRGVFDLLAEEAGRGSADDRRPGQGLAGHARPDAPDPAE